MLAALGVWLYVTGLATIYGQLALDALGRLLPGTADPPPSPALVPLVGLATLSMLAGLVSLDVIGAVTREASS